MWPQRFRASITTAAAALASVSAATGSCPEVPAHTLSSACNGACEVEQACMAPATTSTSCRCFGVGKDQLLVLIPFDKATIAALRASPPATYETIAGKDDTALYSWASNDDLTTVAALNLSSVVSSVVLRGGSSMDGLNKSFVANVDIDDKFLSGQTQLTWITVENLDLKDSMSKLAANLPSSLLSIGLQNNLLTEFPTPLTTLTALQTLNLGYNNIADINSNHEMSELTSLSLQANKISSFTAYFPKLSHLDLSYNQLTAVPEVIAKHSLLTSLYLNGNNIPAFTQSHAIANLKTLTLFMNNMTQFDAILPNLEYLDLSINDFTEFPVAIYNSTKLTTLYLDDNTKMKNVSFTNEQANFINTLSTFKIDKESLQSDCAESEQYYFSTAQAYGCISGGINRTIIMSSRIIPETPAPTPSGTSINSGSGNSSHTAVIIGAVCGAIVVIVAIIVGAYCYRAKKQQEKSGSTTNGGMTTMGIDGTLTNYTSIWNNPELLAVKVSVDEIQDVRKIGSGAFADVWLVKFRKTQFAASKRLRKDQVTLERTQGFIKEIKLVSTLQHPSIVQFMGAAWVMENDLQALFEFMEGGDLRSYLIDSRSPREWGTEKLQIAVDIAEALVYVHSFAPPLVHRDLKSLNVLLATDARAKLTDFGVSRVQSEQNTMTTGVGTGRWLAPEVISGSLNYGPPSDIFSFGAVLSELDSHELPYGLLRGANGNQLADVAMLQLVSTGQLKPTFSASCPEKIAELANRCVAFNPADRPTALEVAYGLRTLLKQRVSMFV